MMAHINLEVYENILKSSLPMMNSIQNNFAPDDWIELVCKGVIVTLEGIGDSKAIDILYSTSSNHTIPAVRVQAFLSLIRLAEVDNIVAIDSIYRMAVENGLLAARQWVDTHQKRPSIPGLEVLFNFVYKDFLPKDERELSEMHHAFFEVASQNLQQRLIDLAIEKDFGNWALIVTLENQLMAHEPNHNDHINLNKLVNSYETFSTPERGFALNRLIHIARFGPPDSQNAAQETIARLFIDQEDLVARDVALEYHYFPSDPEKRAIFFFLTCAWSDYEAIDVNYSILTNAFEYGSKSFRRRLIDHGRKHGYIDWIRGPGLISEVRWASDLTDADWEFAVNKLSENQRWSELFQLAQVSPVFWSARIITCLGNKDWHPQEETDRSAFELLYQLAQACNSSSLLLDPITKEVYEGRINCLAMHPQGDLLAGGSNSQEILLLALPGISIKGPVLKSPSPVVRSLVFSPDGNMLAATTGDHRIRIYRVNDGTLIKSLEGHTAMVRSLAFHPDGRLLASASFDGSIRLWRFPHGTELKQLLPGKNHSEIFCLSISPDGQKLLAAGSDQKISIWSIPDGTLINQLKGHEDTITHLAISPTIDWAASFSRDCTIKIWNYNSGRLVNTIDLLHNTLVSLLFHPTANFLIGTGMTNNVEKDHEIMVWNLSTGKLLEKVSCHSNTITGVAISPKGDHIYCCDSTGKIFSLDIHNFLFMRSFPYHKSAADSNEGVFLKQFSLEEINLRLSDARITAAERNWLRFTIELIRFRQRFDIGLDESIRISVGEFDIEL